MIHFLLNHASALQWLAGIVCACAVASAGLDNDPDAVQDHPPTYQPF